MQQLTLELKNDDPTVRRQAVEALVPYGGNAASELVKAVSDEAGVVAASLMRRAANGGLGELLSLFFGERPWQTPFMESAIDCLERIGRPSVPHILNQLAIESIAAERILAEAKQQQAPEKPNLAQSLGQWGFLFNAAGRGLRTGITRQALATALVEIGQPAVPDLLDALKSPRLLVRMTSYEILAQIPGATEPTIQRLNELAARSSSIAERDQFLAAIRQFQARGR